MEKLTDEELEALALVARKQARRFDNGHVESDRQKAAEWHALADKLERMSEEAEL